jgi:hypothetical protein
MDAEVMVEGMNYPAVKKRAVSSRAFRVKIPSSNSTSFLPSQTINVDLPSNLAGQFYDFQNQMYLKLRLKLTGTYVAGESVALDRGGIFSILKRVSLSTAGATICDVNNYNLLCTALLDTDASFDYRASVGQTLLGITNTLRGRNWVSTTAGGVGVTDETGYATFCVPLICLPVSNCTPMRYIPAFSLSPLQLRIVLEDFNVAFQTGAAAANHSYIVDEVEVVARMIELSPSAMSQLSAYTGGQYSILCNAWANATGTKEAAAQQITAPLGFSFSSLERVLIIHRDSAKASSKGHYSLGNRAKAHLSQFNLLINSEMYPARVIDCSAKDGAEALAEYLLADHSLTAFSKSTCLNNGFVLSAASATIGIGFSQSGGFSLPTIGRQYSKSPFTEDEPDGNNAGATAVAEALPLPAVAAAASNIGTFICAVELEGLSHGKSSTTYSGISTLGSTTQFVGQYSAATAQSMRLDFFGQYTILMNLNMNGSGVWSVSV